MSAAPASCAEPVFRLLLDGDARVRAATGAAPAPLARLRRGDRVDAWLMDAERPVDPISRRIARLRAGCAGLYMTVRPVHEPEFRFAARLVPVDGGAAVALELQPQDLGQDAEMPVFGDRPRLMAALDEAAAAGVPVVAGCVGVDRLRQINIGFGYRYGDAVLAEVGQRLLRLVGSRDVVTSLDGNEFGVLLRGAGAHDRAAVLARALAGVMDRPVFHYGHELFVTVSAGFSEMREPPVADPEAPLQEAVAALAGARQRGRRGLVMGGHREHHRETETLRMEVALRHALEREEFSLCYQPVVMRDTGELHGVEALLRWHNPVLGDIPPDVFIPVLEETGLIESVGAWVLQRACRDVISACSSRGKPLRLAVNLSVGQLHRPEFEAAVRAALHASGLAPERLTLEVTEHLLVERSRPMAETLSRLRETGVRLAVDDFGTGYSSLAYLHQLPVQTLKVDRSFVRGVSESEAGRSVVRAILAMADSLGLETVVEGVETAEEAAFFAGWPGLLAQGYLYGRPAALRALRADYHVRLAG